MIQLWNDNELRQQFTAKGHDRIKEYNPLHFSTLLHHALDTVIPKLKEKNSFFQ